MAKTSQEDWVEVRRKKDHAQAKEKFLVWTVKKGKGCVEDETVASFFFTEFPNAFGLVSEVFVPHRRDKRGNRYGFIRYKKVTNVRVMATRLDNIFIKGRKLHTNVSRFQRKENVHVKSQNNGRAI
ncbi:unnamed protein product [Lathyrus sativus]|nr:unnamed protein product [Lathyrus sativus]